MYRLAVFYAPENKTTSVKINKLAAALRQYPDLSVVCEAVSTDSFVQIQAADLMLFGQEHAGNGAHPDFNEIVRALKGINLSGRMAGFFHFSKAQRPSVFINALKDTGVRCFKKELVLDDEPTPWVEEFYREFKDGLPVNS